MKNFFRVFRILVYGFSVYLLVTKVTEDSAGKFYPLVIVLVMASMYFIVDAFVGIGKSISNEFKRIAEWRRLRN